MRFQKNPEPRKRKSFFHMHFFIFNDGAIIKNREMTISK